jgi:4,5-dihydroxyphthalate decarboxylase
MVEAYDQPGFGAHHARGRWPGTPELVRALYQALLASKALADAGRAAGEPDLTPFGVEPNRRALEILIRYSHEQRLIPRRFSVDELFEDFHRIMG